VLFGGNGMHPRDVMRIVDLGWGARAGVWLVWLVPLAHVTRAVWDAPESHYLRTLPLSRRALAWVPATLLLAVESPWAVLFGLGAGPLAGARAWLSAAGAHALVFARVRGVRDAVAGLILAAAILVPHPTDVAVSAAATGAVGLAALWAIGVAWDRAPERRRPRVIRWVRGLVTTNLAAIVRQEGALLWRAAFIVGAGGGIALLGTRNNAVVDPGSAVRLVLAVGAATLVAALGGPAAATLRADERDAWLLDLAGAALRRRRRAAAAAVAVVGAVAGAVHGLAGAQGALRPLLASAGLGALLGAWLVGAVWRARTFARMYGMLLATAIAATVAFALAGEVALLPLAALAGVAVW
jgi:hypothetical protein